MPIFFPLCKPKIFHSFYLLLLFTLSGKLNEGLNDEASIVTIVHKN